MASPSPPSSSVSVPSSSSSEAARSGEVTVWMARREDLPLVIDMIQELAEFEGCPDGPELTVERLAADGFDCTPPWFFCLVAWRGGRGGTAVGQALCSRAYSSWCGRAMYLEDLFVRPAARRAGVATRLMTHLAQMAVSEGVSRIDWHVLLDNAPARALYRRAGARDLRDTEGRAALRLDREQIRALASGGPALASGGPTLASGGPALASGGPALASGGPAPGGE